MKNGGKEITELCWRIFWSKASSPSLLKSEFNVQSALKADKGVTARRRTIKATLEACPHYWSHRGHRWITDYRSKEERSYINLNQPRVLRIVKFIIWAELFTDSNRIVSYVNPNWQKHEHIYLLWTQTKPIYIILCVHWTKTQLYICLNKAKSWWIDVLWLHYVFFFGKEMIALCFFFLVRMIALC